MTMVNSGLKGLRRLHWLPAASRIIFKLLLFTFHVMNGTASYIKGSILSPYIPTCSLRSEKNLYARPD